MIVLAEDNAELRQLLSGGLERVGFEVIQADNGADLVAKVRQATAAGGLALIVTDVRMPVLGGIAAIRTLREAGVTTPVIFMTAFGDVRVADEAASLNGTLIDKPLGLHSLRAAVAQALGLPIARGNESAS